MTYVCIALLALLAWREWSTAKEQRLREDAWRLERVALLQRIQAPEIAVREAQVRPERKPVFPVPVDDDKAYAEAQERRLNGPE